MTDEQYLVYVLTKYVPIDPKPGEGAWISEFDTAISNIEKNKTNRIRSRQKRSH